jgi:hypothetical protein
MIYLVYEQDLKLYVASSVDSLNKQKGSDATKVPMKAYLFYILNLSPRNAVLSRGIGNVSSKSRTCALVVKSKPMRGTFAPTRSWG